MNSTTTQDFLAGTWCSFLALRCLTHNTSHVAQILRRFRRVCAAVGSKCITLSQAVHGKTFTPTHRSASSFYFMQCDTGKSSRIHVKHVWTQHRGSRGRFEWWIAIWRQRLSRLESSRHRRNEPISRPEVIYFWGISVDEIPYEERHPCNIVLQGELVYDCVPPKCNPSENRSAKCASSWVYIIWK